MFIETDIHEKCLICGRPWDTDQVVCPHCGSKNKVANSKIKSEIEHLEELKNKLGVNQ